MEFKELTWGCQNFMQVVEVLPPDEEAIIIANVYDQGKGSEVPRPAKGVAWGEIARHRRVIIARDMNAHSKMWNPKSICNRNHNF